MSYHEERECPNGWNKAECCIFQPSASFRHRCEDGACPHRIKHYRAGVEIMEFYTLPGNEGVIEIINVCTLVEHLFPGYFNSLSTVCPDYEEETKAIMKWAEENDAHIYSRPREDFFIFRGVKEAIAAGKKAVIVEDMS